MHEWILLSKKIIIIKQLHVWFPFLKFLADGIGWFVELQCQGGSFHLIHACLYASKVTQWSLSFVFSVSLKDVARRSRKVVNSEDTLVSTQMKVFTSMDSWQ